MTALTEIEALAEKTAQEALKQDTPLQSRIDALKILAPYYAALKKAVGQEVPPSDEPTIEDMRVQIERENGNGGKRVQARTHS